jgi:hypothetical protein
MKRSSEMFALWEYFQELSYLALEPLFHKPVGHIAHRHYRLFLRTRNLLRWIDVINSSAFQLFDMNRANHVTRVYYWCTR